MLTHDVAASLEHDVIWERAAKFLDLDPLALRQIREPRFESLARIPSPSGTALLHLAAGTIVHRETLATFTVEPGASVREALFDLQCDAALTGGPLSIAAIALQTVGHPDERELWDCARDCAPILTRHLGPATLLPSDLPSSTLGRWICGAALPFGAEVSLADESSPQRTADALISCATLALREHRKSLSGSSMSVMGSGTLAQASIRAFSEAGAKVVVVADESGAIADSKGLPTSELISHLEAGGLIAEFPGSRHVLRAEALATETDVVFWFDPHPARDVTKQIRSKVLLFAPGVTVNSEDQAEGVTVTILPGEFPRAARLFGALHRDELLRNLEPIWKAVNDIRHHHDVSLSFAFRLYTLQKLAEREWRNRPQLM